MMDAILVRWLINLFFTLAQKQFALLPYNMQIWEIIGYIHSHNEHLFCFYIAAKVFYKILV